MSITQVDPHAACYSVVVEKDVFVRMRDGIHIAVDVYRPDAPGTFPTLYAVSPYQFEIEVWPTSWVFKKGHRIRLELANGDSRVFDAPFGHHYGLKMGTDTIYHDARHPSHVLLPISPKTARADSE